MSTLVAQGYLDAESGALARDPKLVRSYSQQRYHLILFSIWKISYALLNTIEIISKTTQWWKGGDQKPAVTQWSWLWHGSLTCRVWQGLHVTLPVLPGRAPRVPLTVLLGMICCAAWLVMERLVVAVPNNCGQWSLEGPWLNFPLQA